MSKTEPNFASANSEIVDAITKQLRSDSRFIANDVLQSVRSQLQNDISHVVTQEITKEIRERLSDESPSQSKTESYFEAGLFFSRWLMAPAFVCLVGAMIGLVLVIALDTFHFLHGIYDPKINSLSQLIDILDLILICSLVVMVMIGGFENTISKISTLKNSGPSWVGHLGIAHLKIKVAASLVLISGVDLLKFYLNIGKQDGNFNNHYLYSTEFDYNVLSRLLIHLTFVATVLILAWVEKILHQANYDER